MPQIKLSLDLKITVNTDFREYACGFSRNKTQLEVERKLNLGGTQVAFGAINSGDIDAYVEYTGTGLVNILKQSPQSDPDKVYDYVKKEFKEKYGIDMLKPLGFNNTYAIAVRQDTAEQFNRSCLRSC